MTYDIDEKILYIFTDGASRSVFNERLKRKTGRHGGKGIRFVYLDKKGKRIEEDKSDYISYTKATNQDMELRSCVDGLEAAADADLTRFNKVMVVTDSMFIYENWKYAWNGTWDKAKRKTIYGDPITHKKKRQQLVKYIQNIYITSHRRVDFDRVKGHKDNEYNKKADGSAVKGAQSKTRVIGNTSEPRAKFFKETIWYKKCFMPIGGQEVFIHIHNSRYLRKKRFRYNYEMVSWDSIFFRHTGRIYYDKATLSAEFIYLVKMKDDGSHQIEEIISQHTKDEIRKKIIDAGHSDDIFFGKEK